MMNWDNQITSALRTQLNTQTFFYADERAGNGRCYCNSSDDSKSSDELASGKLTSYPVKEGMDVAAGPGWIENS